MQHHNNAPCHTAISLNEFLTEKGIPVVPQPPYSPDLSPCDFFLFPKLKFHLKGSHIAIVDNIQTIVTDQLRHFYMKTSSTATGSGSNVSGSVRLPKTMTLKGIMCIIVQLLIKNFIVLVSLLFRQTLYSPTNNKSDKHFISIVTDYLPFAFNVEILYQLRRGVLPVKTRPHKSSAYTFMFPRGSKPSS